MPQAQGSSISHLVSTVFLMHFVCVKQNNKEECIAGTAYAKCLRRSAIKNGTLLIFLTLQDTVPVMSQKVGHVIDFILSNDCRVHK